VVTIKRSVIQIANSTQLISLPRKWSQKYGIKKGDELEIEEHGNKLQISTEKGFEVEKCELNIDDLEPLVLRYLVALYKRGVDEIKITFTSPELIQSLQKAIGKEAVGFEITEQGKDYCIIKHVSGELEDFEPVLRRTFILLLSMADESLNSIKKIEYSNLSNIAFLEEANNRFTTTCRRFLNKKGYADSRKIGPLYYIIEEIENIADQYKYLCNYLYGIRDKKPKISKEILDLYQIVNNMLKQFYEVYYKFDRFKLVALTRERKSLINRFNDVIEKGKNSHEKIVAYHLFTIMQKIFCLIGPYLVIQYD